MKDLTLSSVLISALLFGAAAAASDKDSVVDGASIGVSGDDYDQEALQNDNSIEHLIGSVADVPYGSPRWGAPPPDGPDLSDGPRRNGIPKDCPNYVRYSSLPHHPLSNGTLRLPFQRPSEECRTFKADSVEEVIAEFNGKLADPDLARLFENCFPNTLDTTISWHKPGKDPRTFVVTGDIDAEWLRDSYRQLRPYQSLAKNDVEVKNLILGAINTQAEYVAEFPYCNAFNPPKDSGMRPPPPAMVYEDTITPPVDYSVVFECKYELDSLASFLGLSNEYYNATKSTDFLSKKWIEALNMLLKTLDEQSQPTYGDHGLGGALQSYYTFQRETRIGTETLSLRGAGNPINANISLVRSAFRPSDDATIFQYFIPANAQLSIELQRISPVLKANGHKKLAEKTASLGKEIADAIWEHGVYHNKVFGDVFAYEIDGFGGINNMDDANLPSLLSLPEIGFVSKDDPVYLNTRKMLLSKAGNPYYLNGTWFKGIGGPHIGVKDAWPMSLLVAIRTTDDEAEIKSLLETIRVSTAGLGLIHESVDVVDNSSFTRPWFAWANSEFANSILDIAERFPHLILKPSAI